MIVCDRNVMGMWRFQRCFMYMVGLIALAVSAMGQVSAPWIYDIDGGGTLELGATATLSPFIFDSGGVPESSLTYQWSKDGVVIAGATGKTYTITGLKASDAATYSVKVGNSVGTTEASTFIKVLALAPLIFVDPGSTTLAFSLYVGESAALEYPVTGSYPRAYQWRKDGVDIPGATSAVYSIPFAKMTDAGSYSVKITNSLGSVTSLTRQIGVKAAIPLVFQSGYPSDVVVTLGGSCTLTPNLTAGSPDILYQWYKNGTLIPGATNYTLTFYPVVAADAGKYKLVATNGAGSATTREAVLKTNLPAPLAITSQPASLTAIAGQYPSFSVSYTGENPTFQWYKDGVAIPGATGSSFTLSPAKVADSGSYTVVLTNAVGSVASAAATLTVNPVGSPAITTQPLGKSLSYYNSFSLSVSANGIAPLSYQWKKDGTPIDGATSTTYSRAAAVTADAGKYTVTITNAIASVTSYEAIVTVAAPVLTVLMSSPTDRSVVVGASTVFEVTYTSGNGVGPLVLQWYKDGVAIPSATGSQYTIKEAKDSDAGSYVVKIVGAAGTVASSVAKLVVTSAPQAPTIIVQPLPQTVVAGQSVTFTVSANGTTPLKYGWSRDGKPFSSIGVEPSATLTLGNLQASDAGLVTVVVSNAYGTVTSTAAKLTVVMDPSVLGIATQPVAQTVVAGSSASFSVTANGIGPFTYQWKRDGASISGATNAALNLTNVQTGDAGSYTVLVSNTMGSVTSAGAYLTVTPAQTVPVISVPPVSQSVTVGGSASFRVNAIGMSLLYQWKKSGTPISGATSEILSLTTVQLSDAGSYTVTVTNSAGSVTSQAAVLTVNTTKAFFAGTYMGRLGTNGSAGNFAVYLRGDGTGVLLIYLSVAKSAIVVNDFKVNADGTFSVQGNLLGSRGVAAEAGFRPQSTILATDSRTITGSIAGDGSVSGTISGMDAALGGAKSQGAANAVGFYQAPAVNGGSGNVYTIVTASGDALVVAQTGSIVDGGTGTVNGSGQLTVSTTSGATVSETVNPSTGAVTATADKGALAGATFTGLRDDVVRTDRLINISTRGETAGGDAVMIAGFVIGGSNPRPVMIRAIGPTLRGYGLPTALADSQLELFNGGGTRIQTSDNWGAESSAAAITTASARVGAFALATDSKDAVVLATLAPGLYSARVTSPAGAAGLALVEVYDAGDTSEPSTQPKLVNISTRARVGTGDSVLIAGFYVNGNGPKKVLVRAIGPTLGGFGVPGSLAAPVLKLLNADSVVLAQNSGWADDPDIATAAAASGGFPLPAGSADACLLLTLSPGRYSAIVSGKNDTTGIALIEVYEVPN